MNKNLLIVGGVVVLLLIGGAGYAFKHQIKTLIMPPAPVQEEVPAGVVTLAPTEQVMKTPAVEYGPSGFVPATITVKKGTAVLFVNKSGVKMSVASNPHPTHTDYPEFDQYKTDARGKDEFVFTFEKVGSWGYHNHAKSSDGGTVVVTE